VFKNLRILTLLLVLLAILIYGWIPSSPKPDWSRPLQVTVFPVNADGSEVAASFISGLQGSDFDPLQRYFQDQAQRHDAPVSTPFHFELGETLTEAPPIPRGDLAGWDKLKWAISLRWWHWRLSRRHPGTDIVVLGRYKMPVPGGIDLHSIGMPSPRLALVSAIADEELQGLNRVKLAHELLHTVGATDLYDPSTGEPLWPAGYAKSAQQPQFPQQSAELMAGRIPTTPRRSRPAGALRLTSIGQRSAREIGWIN
jgi:hypothetical protein